MKIGKKTQETSWKLGDMNIGTCDSYTYLGDVITPDGKNTDNIKSRKRKYNLTF